MRDIDAIEMAYNNGKGKGYVEGWNDAIEYITETIMSKFLKKRGLNTDHQRISEITESKKGENENDKSVD